jgi:hypothetical protein
MNLSRGYKELERIIAKLEHLKGLYQFFLMAVLVYAFLLITLPLLSLANAQQSDRVQRLLDQRAELELRLAQLEDLKLDHRVTVIETILKEQENNGRWALGSSVGTGLLLGAEVVRAIKKRSAEKE